MFSCTLLYVCSSIAIILMGKRELIALLNLSSWCLLMVERLFLALPWGCLRFVIVVFPDHTHLLFLQYLDSVSDTTLITIILHDVSINGQADVRTFTVHKDNYLDYLSNIGNPCFGLRVDLVCPPELYLNNAWSTLLGFGFVHNK